MKRNKVINQLKSIQDDSLFNLSHDYDEVWADDVSALNYAIRVIKRDKRSKEEFWKGVTLATIVMLIFHFLWIL